MVIGQQKSGGVVATPLLAMRGIGTSFPAVRALDGVGLDVRPGEAHCPAGHGLGYEHGFTHQVVDLVTAIAKGDDPTPSFADGLQVQRVLAAVERSGCRAAWTQVPA